jgi:hypothetical protein
MVGVSDDRGSPTASDAGVARSVAVRTLNVERKERTSVQAAAIRSANSPTVFRVSPDEGGVVPETETDVSAVLGGGGSSSPQLDRSSEISKTHDMTANRAVIGLLRCP